MSQSSFAGNLEDALEGLEAVTGALRQSDPDDLTAMGVLLARRHQAVVAVTSQLGPEQRWPEAQTARLQQAWQQLEERLKLVAAGTRHQLQELYRAAFHTRALSADIGQLGQNVQIDA
jgi:hypothetical protein